MECGEDSLRAWWNPNDYIGLDGETILTNDSVTESVVKLVLNQLKTDESHGLKVESTD